MTSSLITKLAEEKKIKLTDQVINYLPGTQLNNEVTIHNILNHSTGYKERLFTAFIESNLSHQEIKQRLDIAEIQCQPGTCYSYQNFIYSLLGDIIHKTTNYSFPIAMNKYIFEPLGMNNSSCDAKHFLNSSNKAMPHIRKDGKFIFSKEDINSFYYKVAPAGGINSSIKDMAIWLAAQMDAFDHVLSSSMLETMQTPYIKVPRKTNSEMIWEERINSEYYGLGWRIIDYSGHKVVYHGGLVKGFTAIVGLMPKDKVGIVVLTNSNTFLPNHLMARFFDTYLGLEEIDYSSIGLKHLIKWDNEVKKKSQKL
jgi:beta-lactamase class C